MVAKNPTIHPKGLDLKTKLRTILQVQQNRKMVGNREANYNKLGEKQSGAEEYMQLKLGEGNEADKEGKECGEL